MLHAPELFRWGILDRAGLARSREPHPLYRDSEWQADEFAGALLAPRSGLAQLASRGLLSAAEVARTYGMSRAAAEHRVRVFLKRGRGGCLAETGD